MALREILLAGYSGQSRAGKIAPSCPLGQPITARDLVHLARSQSYPYTNIKYWTSPELNAIRLPGLFANKTTRKHRKLIFPHKDFIIQLHSIVSMAIFHPHFSIRILSSPCSIRVLSSSFYHPQFSIRILSSSFFYPPSAIRRHPVRTLQRP